MRGRELDLHLYFFYIILNFSMYVKGEIFPSIHRTTICVGENGDKEDLIEVKYLKRTSLKLSRKRI